MSEFTCPVPGGSGQGRITLAHGEGGRLTRQLIQRRIRSRFANQFLEPLGDAAVLPPLLGSPVFTTDSYVVSPLFFPGGDIGRLAIFGTVNDLAVSGARPCWISLALILEEGLAEDELDRVLASVRHAADEAGVAVVTGDTKVVPRGAADRLFVTTAGLGERLTPALEGPAQLAVGDCLLVTGPVGRHGMAILAARERLGIEPSPVSDCSSLWPAVAALWQAGVPVRALRDATRGGLAAVLQEWAEASGHTLLLDGDAVPLTPEVRGLSELLGIDPVHVACEGTMVVAVAAEHLDEALRVLRTVPVASETCRVGQVVPRGAAPVTIRRPPGRPQPLDEPLGAPLPRIC
ncbi:MAG: hydrogenase expression/formation protein HypE [Pirellulales bacterium]